MKLFLSIGLLLTVTLAARAQDVVGNPISPWQPGMSDIHQDQHRPRNAGLYILPDGTTLLVDAGEHAAQDRRTHSGPPGRQRAPPASGSCATSGRPCHTTHSRHSTTGS